MFTQNLTTNTCRDSIKVSKNVNDPNVFQQVNIFKTKQKAMPHIYKGILLNNKKEQTFDTCNSLVGSQ